MQFERIKSDPSDYDEIRAWNQRRIDRTAQLLVLTPEEILTFSSMVESHLDELNPIRIEQTDLVIEIAVARWRQQGCWGIEGDGPTRMAMSQLKPHNHVKALALVTRLEGRLRRLHERARKNLDRLRAKKPNEPKSKAIPVIPPPLQPRIRTSEPKSTLPPETPRTSKPKGTRAA